MNPDTKQNEPVRQRSATPPESGGRIDRITDQTKGLVDDIKEWIDLRVRLVQLDLEERFETIANQTILTLVVIGIGATSLLFAMIAAALGLGTLLSSPALGFLSVSLTLAFVMWLINRWRPKFVNTAIMTAARRGQAAAKEEVSREVDSDSRAINAQLPAASEQNENAVDEHK